MKQIKFLVLFFIPILSAFYACNGQNQNGNIKGTMTGASNLQVKLEQAHFDRSTVALSSGSCDGKGNFDLKLEKPFEEGLYVLSLGAKKLYFMLGNKDNKVTINGNLGTLEKMELETSGSENLKCYTDILSSVIKKQLKTPEEAKSNVEKGCTPLMKAFLLTQFLGQNAGAYISDFEAQSKMLTESMPGSKYATDYANMVTQIKNSTASKQSAELINVGQVAPDISLPGPDGTTHSLAGLKGKVVLLDFWASWCGPCRRENPRVVEVYKKYKSKGFEIFSVSLDGVDPRRGAPADQIKTQEEDGKRKWKEAIAKDGLLWDNHVSDLKHWASAPAAVYGVSSIPKTFLIDREGKIIAINPRENLEEALLKAL